MAFEHARQPGEPGCSIRRWTSAPPATFRRVAASPARGGSPEYRAGTSSTPATRVLAVVCAVMSAVLSASGSRQAFGAGSTEIAHRLSSPSLQSPEALESKILHI